MLRLPAPPQSRPTQALRAPRVQSGQQSAAASEVGAQTESGRGMIGFLMGILFTHIFWGAVIIVYFWFLSRDPAKPRIVR